MSKIQVHVLAHTHTHTHTHTHACMQAQILCTRAYTYTYAHTHMHIHICTYTHAHTCIHTRVHTHTHMYTHSTEVDMCALFSQLGSAGYGFLVDNNGQLVSHPLLKKGWVRPAHDPAHSRDAPQQPLLPDGLVSLDMERFEIPDQRGRMEPLRRAMLQREVGSWTVVAWEPANRIGRVREVGWWRRGKCRVSEGGVMVVEEEVQSE